MKNRILAGVAVTIWLLLWASDIGVLVSSREDPVYPGGRACYYLIGLSIVRKVRPEYDRAGRCPLLTQV
jgi:hypothetical protein